MIIENVTVTTHWQTTMVAGVHASGNCVYSGVLDFDKTLHDEMCIVGKNDIFGEFFFLFPMCRVV